MIILILVVCIVLLITGTILTEKLSGSLLELVWWGFGLIGLSIGAISIIAMLILVSHVVGSSAMEKKISMYQQENKDIESQINELVTNYMKYENETLTKFKIESSVTLVSMYPELKADALVKSQIGTYTKNNNKIKKLKEDKIMRSVYRWWLYFGK